MLNICCRARWLFVVVSPLLFGMAAYAELIPATRLTDWTAGTRVGVPGGIDQYLPGGAKARTTLIDVTKAPYNADKTGATNTAAAIQAAINAATAGQVAYLPAGTYRIDSQLSVDFNRTILRFAEPGRLLQLLTTDRPTVRSMSERRVTTTGRGRRAVTPSRRD